MSAVYKYTLLRNGGKQAGFRKEGNSDLFNLNHFFLVNSGVDIAFYHRYEAGSVQKFEFYSLDKESLEKFKAFVERENPDILSFFKEEISNGTENTDRALETLKKMLRNGVFERIQRNFIGSDIIDVSELYRDDNVEFFKYKRIRPRTDKLSRSNLRKTINYVIKGMKEGKTFTESLKRDIQVLLSAYGVENVVDDQGNIQDSFVENFRKRLKKIHHEFFINAAKFSNGGNGQPFDGLFFMKEIEIEEKPNFEVNRYGLSTKEKIFPIPR